MPVLQSTLEIMSVRRPAPRLRATVLVLLAFVAAGALLLVPSVPLWIRLLFVGLAIGALLGQARRATVAYGWEVDGEGVRELRAGVVVGRVRWSELVAVSMVTTAEGPWSPEFFYVLHGSAGGQLVVPLEHAAVTSLLGRLGRLPGFDHQAVLRATSSSSSAEFLCWEGEPGEGAAAGGELDELD
jgi:hypothetical protein